jgi:tRNA (adenine57-N1/adenine58-N1)-methyltransferase catalytic subunit
MWEHIVTLEESKKWMAKLGHMAKRPVHPPASRDPRKVGPRRTGVLIEGEMVQLIDARANKYTISLMGQGIFHSHRGQISHDDMIGQPEGIIVQSDRQVDYQVLRPQLDDYVLSMPRGAAVVYPKDAARIVGLADLGAGSRVLEAGVGSGALTCSLLRTVGPTGSVVSVEMREDFADVAIENVCRWFGGFPHSWEVEVGDLAEWDPQARKFDAVVLDMLAPWKCLDIAELVLRPGGALVIYVATTTQLSRIVETLRLRSRWSEPRAEESMLRTWHLDGLSVRPDHKMNGHTGFLVSARVMAPDHVSLKRKRRPAPGAYGEDYQAPNPFGGNDDPGIASGESSSESR